jgi:protein involved in polysaccharide export with SLBB domain
MSQGGIETMNRGEDGADRHGGILFAKAGLLAALVVLAGCRRSAPPPEQLSWDLAEAPTMLTAGDVIEVKFFFTPEFNELQTIRPDGKIAMQVVGDVAAEGKTPEELCRTLGELYKTQLRESAPVVLVRTFSTRRVYVVGEVFAPGAVAIQGAPLSVLEAVALAGGTNPRTAETRNVLVIRRTGDGRCQGFGVDLSDALAGKAASIGSLQPQDIVYVPRTRIVEINQWINQHINQIIPRLGMIYTATSGGVTTGVNLSNGVAGP